MKDFERQKRDIWTCVQKELGFRASPEVKEIIHEVAGDIVCLEDVDCYANSVYEMLHIVKLNAMAQYLPPQKKTPDNRKKMYLGAFQKRLHLVEFIINHQLALRRYKNKRIKWKQTCVAWNAAHPYAPTTPQVLKATFHRAAAEENVQTAIYLNQEKEARQLLNSLMGVAKEKMPPIALIESVIDNYRKLAMVVPDGKGELLAGVNKMLGYLEEFKELVIKRTPPGDIPQEGWLAAYNRIVFNEWNEWKKQKEAQNEG